MNESKFKTFLAAAQSIGGDYWSGYSRGLRRHQHGSSFGTDAEHEKWMSLTGPRDEMGNGYREGYAGHAPRGFHGNLGNMNASGELPADSHLHIRVNSKVKAAFVKQANRENLKLSEWVLKTLSKTLG